jgi:hypothetical protein
VDGPMEREGKEKINSMVHCRVLVDNCGNSGLLSEKGD